MQWSSDRTWEKCVRLCMCVWMSECVMEIHEASYFSVGCCFCGEVPKSSNICCVKDAAYVRGAVEVFCNTHMHTDMLPFITAGSTIKENCCVRLPK